MSDESLRGKFPSLATSPFQITSPATGSYTCIGYAAGDASRIWLPDPWPEGAFYWPEGAPREPTLSGWAGAFAALGYHECESRELESGFEKIAIYADARGDPQHVARQLATGRWTSKVGKMEDIEHELEGLEGEAYGSVVLVLRRTAGGMAE